MDATQDQDVGGNDGRVHISIEEDGLEEGEIDEGNTFAKILEEAKAEARVKQRREDLLRWGLDALSNEESPIRTVWDLSRIPKRTRLPEYVCKDDHCICRISKECPHKELLGRKDCLDPYAPPPKIQRCQSESEAELSRLVNTRGDGDGTQRSEIDKLKYIIRLFKKGQHLPFSERRPIHEAMRIQVHKMEFFDFLCEEYLETSRILTKDNGLPLIFEDSHGGRSRVPWDIKADTKALYLKWERRGFDPHLLCGIETTWKKRQNGKEFLSRSLIKGYKDKVSCDYEGEGTLHNGQWFACRLSALVQGAHGQTEAGISGKIGVGAQSVVLSRPDDRPEYADVDEGDEVSYVSTSGQKDEPSRGTRLLLESYKLGTVIRVLRGWKLPEINPYRPSHGVRYDGLYKITGYELLEEDTALHRFTLIREEGQDPIRFKGPEKLPTAEEIQQLEKIWELERGSRELV